MGSRADSHERILEISFVQKKVILFKHGDRTCWRKEPLPWGCEEWLMITWELGEVRKKGGVQKDFHLLIPRMLRVLEPWLLSS